MEARCTACRVYGGEEHPCCDLTPYAQRDRPCPRVQLEPDNAISFQIVAKAGIEPAGLFNAWLPLHMRALGLTGGQSLIVLERAMATLSHPIVEEYKEREIERSRASAKG